MKAQEVLEKIKSGEYSIELYSHEVGCYGTREHFTQTLDDWVNMANGGNDGKWSSFSEDRSVEEVDKSMREFYQYRLNDSCRDGFLVPFEIKANCYACAEQLYWYINEAAKRVELCGYSDFDGPRNKEGGPFHCKEEGKRECPFKDVTSFKSSISVNSKLIFANYFDFPDSEEKDEYTDEWSLNNTIGRYNITHFKAKKNIAYGQMGNMSVGIYYNKIKQEIIVSTPYAFDVYRDDKEEEKRIIASRKKILRGFKLMGDISLGVWRWEATDLNTLTEDKLKEIKAKSHPQDIVEFDVSHGTWDFEHFYDFGKNDDDNPDFLIYSHFKLRK